MRSPRIGLHLRPLPPKTRAARADRQGRASARQSRHRRPAQPGDFGFASTPAYQPTFERRRGVGASANARGRLLIGGGARPRRPPSARTPARNARALRSMAARRRRSLVICQVSSKTAAENRVSLACRPATNGWNSSRGSAAGNRRRAVICAGDINRAPTSIIKCRFADNASTPAQRPGRRRRRSALSAGASASTFVFKGIFERRWPPTVAV